MIKTKKEFVYVRPKSKKAINRFHNMMDQFNSCVVNQRKDGKLFLASISGRYFFWIPDTGDEHWEIIK